MPISSKSIAMSREIEFMYLFVTFNSAKRAGIRWENECNFYNFPEDAGAV
jgi:hypothetical protein